MVESGDKIASNASITYKFTLEMHYDMEKMTPNNGKLVYHD